MTSRIQGFESSLAIKAPVRVATIANIALQGLQTIDGVVLLEDQRVLVMMQSDARQNGIYVATTGAWSRATDFNGARDVVKGTRIIVTDGAQNGGRIFFVTTNNPIILGTTPLAFASEETSGFDAISPITQLGDMIYGGVGGSSLRLSGNTSTARTFLSQTGDGANSAAPAWNALGAADLPIVPIAKGGTGETTKTSAFDALAPSTTKGDLIVYNGTNHVRLPSGADGAVLVASSASTTGLVWDSVAGGASAFSDNAFRIQDNVDASKRIAFEASGISTGATRTFSVPNQDDTLVGASAAQTLTNKTLNQPVISSISNSGVLTLPTITDTLVGRTTTDTLTNKTLSSPTITGGAVNAASVQVAGAHVLTTNSTLNALADVDAGSATVHGANYTLEYSSVTGGYALDTVTGGGEVNTASNVGSSGVGLFKQKSGANLEFKQIVAGSNITISGGANEVTISGGAGGGGGATALNDLSDVTLASPATGQVLRYNGTVWANSTVAGGGGGIYTNVKEVFGAVGDGVADDTAAIQSAFNFAANNGAMLFFPKGQYRITAPITATVVNGATDPQSTIRLGMIGEGIGLTWFVWDGANTPNTYMFTIQSQDTNDTNNTHAFSDFRDFSVATKHNVKDYYVSGMRFIRRAFMQMSRVGFRRLHVALQLDDVISSTFDSLIIRMNNHGCRSYGAAHPASDAEDVPYDNNAQTWINCIFGINRLTGFDFRRGSFNFFGGTIEVNGHENSAGNGYGVRIEAQGNTAPFTANFYGVHPRQVG